MYSLSFLCGYLFASFLFIYLFILQWVTLDLQCKIYEAYINLFLKKPNKLNTVHLYIYIYIVPPDIVL